jgi:Zn-dependent oligopeptidase
MTAFKRKVSKNNTALFEAWDWGYYASKFDAEALNWDESEMSDYFPSERVV